MPGAACQCGGRLVYFLCSPACSHLIEEYRRDSKKVMELSVILKELRLKHGERISESR